MFSAAHEPACVTFLFFLAFVGVFGLVRTGPVVIAFTSMMMNDDGGGVKARRFFYSFPSRMD